MEQPIRMKNNGQINIVFNGKREKRYRKMCRLKKYMNVTYPEQHVALKEIEDGTRKASWYG